MIDINPANIRKVLIRTTNWIGDAVMTTPAMGAVRCMFPNAEVVVAANPVTAELFSFHPYCDRVIVYDKETTHHGVAGLWNFSRALRQEGFDLALLFQNAIEASIISYLARIPIRAGYRTDGRGLLLTHPVPVGPAEKRLHHTLYYINMLKCIGIHGGNGLLRLACTETELSQAANLLGMETRWVAINPGAAYGSAKRWFPDRFAGVADLIQDELGCRIVLTGSQGESEIGRDIEERMHTPPLNLIGKTSVRELMALLSLCRLVITNDSGPMHIAAAMGVPIVALFGSTDHTTTSPQTDRCRIVRKPVDCAPCLKRICPGDHRCMNAITIEDVMPHVRDLLAKKESSGGAAETPGEGYSMHIP